MLGSEAALEEPMCRVLGDCLKGSGAAKLADDLYCGADTTDELLVNWTQILNAFNFERATSNYPHQRPSSSLAVPSFFDGFGHKVTYLQVPAASLLSSSPSSEKYVVSVSL